MRISCDKNDEAYFPSACLCKAFLDDQDLQLAVTVDEERGYAICYDVDANDKFVSNPDGSRHTVKRRGRVRIEVPADVRDLVPPACFGPARYRPAIGQS